MRLAFALFGIAAALSLSVSSAAAQPADVPAAPNPAPASNPAKASGGANLGSAQLYAEYTAAGVLVEERSKGSAPCPGVDCGNGGGFYQVYFARDVSACQAVVNTIGPARIPSVQLGPTPNSVRVDIYSAATDTFVDTPFKIIVIC